MAVAAVAFGACLGLGSACSKTEDNGVLREEDLKTPKGLESPFDPNAIVDNDAFADIDSIDVATVQKVLHKTPYGRPSFLETYQSNGVRASDAILQAAITYRINPLVFLIEAQAAEGLVGESEYPFPTNRVEYVFRCGCLDENTCLPAVAGFDRQVNCLGRNLRVALDQMSSSGVAASGWGKGTASLTLDNIAVTPANEATAAVYDRRPRVAMGAPGGTWLFWNLWTLYASAASYGGPIGGIGTSGWVGDACTKSATCGFQGATCASDYPDGLCTATCNGTCPSQQGKREAFCADFNANGGFCLAVCNPGAPACRKGYTCTRLKRFGGAAAADAQFVCSVP